MSETCGRESDIRYRLRSCITAMWVLERWWYCMVLLLDELCVYLSGTDSRLTLSAIYDYVLLSKVRRLQIIIRKCHNRYISQYPSSHTTGHQDDGYYPDAALVFLLHSLYHKPKTLVCVGRWESWGCPVNTGGKIPGATVWWVGNISESPLWCVPVIHLERLCVVCSTEPVFVNGLSVLVL